ncbi:LodA/GoxA family CTQ-dependent oxidase [Bradyrhizobium barranii]
MATYRIHPGIGIARLGNSDSEFYLAPETPPRRCRSPAIVAAIPCTAPTGSRPFR